MVTLHASFLESLSNGSHELRALFDDGNDPTVSFTVKGAGVPGDALPGEGTAAASGAQEGATATGELNVLPTSGFLTYVNSRPGVSAPKNMAMVPRTGDSPLVALAMVGFLAALATALICVYRVKRGTKR